MVIPTINAKQIILASQSPRRQEIIGQLGIQVAIVVKPNIDESYPNNLKSHEIPLFLAKHKALAYHDELSIPNTIVITADTIVSINETVLGKPKDKKEAIEILQLLSGQCHQVITGVAITSQEKQTAFIDTTNVWFKKLSMDEINYYIDHYKPYDKAGAYGIQEWIGMIGIEKIEGSYYNVVGLPIQKLYEALSNF